MMVASILAASYGKKRAVPLLVKAFLSTLCTPNPFDSIFTGQEASDFMELAQRSGVTKVGFLRHGNTTPKPVGGADFDRILTDQGREQATTAGSLFGKKLGKIYPRILVSPSPRTVETASLFLGAAIGSRWEDQVDMISIQGLYDGTMQPEGSLLFQRIGYAPLRDYIDIDTAIINRKGDAQSEIEGDVQVAQKLLGDYAKLSVEAIQSTMRFGDELSLADGAHTDSRGHVLWIVAHAVYLPAAALGLAAIAQCDKSSRHVILRTNTKEAEGYLIDLNESTVTYLSRAGGI